MARRVTETQSKVITMSSSQSLLLVPPCYHMYICMTESFIVTVPEHPHNNGNNHGKYAHTHIHTRIHTQVVPTIKIS